MLTTRAARICWLSLITLLGSCAPGPQKELKSGAKAIILTGKIYPVQEAEVTAPISAIVEKILIEPGAQVKPGQILLRLDESGAKADLTRAQAAVATARAALAEARTGAPEAQRAEAEAEVERLAHELRLQKSFGASSAMVSEYEQSGIVLENAKAKLERLYALFARKLVSKPEVESAQNEYADALRRYESSRETLERKITLKDSETRMAEARYNAARARLAAVAAGGSGGSRLQVALAQLRQAEAEVDRATQNLEQSIIKAPIAGVVTDVTAQAGNKVYEGRALAKIADIARVRVQADLSPGLLPFVHVGQKAKVTVNSVPPATVESNVARIKTVADPKTQALEITLILPNPNFKFQPGFTARVEIAVEPDQEKKLPLKELSR